MRYDLSGSQRWDSSVGNQEIGAVEERYYGSHRAFQTTVDVAELGVFPDGYIELGVFPNFELAKQAVCEAHQP
jgi:hypothetical protein